MLTVNLHRVTHARADSGNTEYGDYVAINIYAGPVEQVTLFFGGMDEIINFYDAAEEALRLAKQEGLPNVRLN